MTGETEERALLPLPVCPGRRVFSTQRSLQSATAYLDVTSDRQGVRQYPAEPFQG
jgi:hypothetical protein